MCKVYYHDPRAPMLPVDEPGDVTLVLVNCAVFVFIIYVLCRGVHDAVSKQKLKDEHGVEVHAPELSRGLAFHLLLSQCVWARCSATRTHARLNALAALHLPTRICELLSQAQSSRLLLCCALPAQRLEVGAGPDAFDQDALARAAARIAHLP